MRFADKLARGWRESGGFLCVGLDPDVERMAPEFARASRPVLGCVLRQLLAVLEPARELGHVVGLRRVVECRERPAVDLAGLERGVDLPVDRRLLEAELLGDLLRRP